MRRTTVFSQWFLRNSHASTRPQPRATNVAAAAASTHASCFAQPSHRAHPPTQRQFHTTPSAFAGPSRRPLPPIVTIDDKLSEFTLDEAITTPEVQVKLPKNAGLSPPQPLSYVLSTIDRTTQHVQQISPVNDTREFAIVRITTRGELVRQVQAKEEAARKQSYALKKRKPKQLELNWAIARSDLELKLKQMETFLEKGKKVELLLANKRHQRKATVQEAEELLDTVRQRVGSLGAKEVVPFEGRFLGQATMVVEKTGG